jgi:hypothetical protein
MKHGPKTECIRVPLTAVIEEHAPSNSEIHDNAQSVPGDDMQEPNVAESPSQPHIGMVSLKLIDSLGAHIIIIIIIMTIIETETLHIGACRTSG